MIEQWIKDLIMERDSMIAALREAAQDFAAEFDAKEKSYRMSQQRYFQAQLAAINKKLGI